MERLNKFNLNNECKHLIPPPNGSPISKRITTWCHKKTVQTGSGMTLKKIQISGFSIVCANSTTRKFIHYCVVYITLRGKLDICGTKCSRTDGDGHSKRSLNLLIVGLICWDISLSAANERN